MKKRYIIGPAVIICVGAAISIVAFKTAAPRPLVEVWPGLSPSAILVSIHNWEEVKKEYQGCVIFYGEGNSECDSYKRSVTLFSPETRQAEFAAEQVARAEYEAAAPARAAKAAREEELQTAARQAALKAAAEQAAAEQAAAQEAARQYEAGRPAREAAQAAAESARQAAVEQAAVEQAAAAKQAAAAQAAARAAAAKREATMLAARQETRLVVFRQCVAKWSAQGANIDQTNLVCEHGANDATGFKMWEHFAH